MTNTAFDDNLDASTSTQEPVVVSTFGSEMLKAFCVQAGLRHATDADGDVVISFGYGVARDCALRVYLYASGRARTILCVRILSDKRYRPEHRVRLMEVINEFHRERRWPKVYLKPSDNTVSVVCEHQVDLAMGAHQALVNDCIDSAISSANTLWRHLAELQVTSVQDEWALAEAQV